MLRQEFPIAVDGRVFMPDYFGVYEEERQGNSQIYELTEDGVVPAFSIVGGGLVSRIVRIR